uniref:Uncharacterized protein n=1 Tax=Poecilia formosa TaxID=48698 RepID=A0A096MF05_POEFO
HLAWIMSPCSFFMYRKVWVLLRYHNIYRVILHNVGVFAEMDSDMQ